MFITSLNAIAAQSADEPMSTAVIRVISGFVLSKKCAITQLSSINIMAMPTRSDTMGIIILKERIARVKR